MNDDSASITTKSRLTSVQSRKFLLFFYTTAVAFYWMSLYFYVPTLPIYIKERVTSLAVVGTILSMYGLWQALIRLPIGIASDWIGWRKPFIVGGFVLSMIGAWVMGTATTAFGMGAGRAITGMAAGTWVPLTVAFSALFPPEEAIRATAILSVVNSLSRMSATSVTGWLNGLGGYGLAFYVAMGVALLAIFVILPIDEKRKPPVEKLTLDGLITLITRHDVISPSVMSALAQYVTWSAALGFIPILASRMGASDVMQSIMVTASIGIITIGNLATAALVKRSGKRALTIVSFCMMAVGSVCAGISPNITWLFVSIFFVSIGSGIASPLLMGMSIDKVDGHQRSTAMGLHQAVYGFGMFAGPWISGALAENIGIQPMFTVTGFVCLALGFLGVHWLFGDPKHLHDGLAKKTA